MKPIIAALLLAGLSPGVPAAPPAESAGSACNADARMVEKERFTVEVAGRGPDVILIPGLSTPREVWSDTCRRLAATHRVHSVQLRGFGDEAGPNGEGPVLEPFVEELASYVEEVSAKPALVGHSMGGLAAMMVAAAHPDLPGKIMVVDALPFFGSIMGPEATVEGIRPRAETLRRMILSPPAAAEGAAGASQSGNLSNTAEGRAAIARWTAAADRRVVAQALYDDFTTDLRPQMPQIEVPITLLYPQDERLVSAELAEATYRRGFEGTPNLEMVRIPQSYHFIMLDQPERFQTELDRFLGR